MRIAIAIGVNCDIRGESFQKKLRVTKCWKIFNRARYPKAETVVRTVMQQLCDFRA